MKSILYKRILAFFIDFIPLCVVFTLILNFVMEKTEKSLLELTNNGVYYAVLLSVGLLSMLKDIFNGASIGKRIVKIKVVDENNQKPSIGKLILRNLTLVIWPLEFYFLLNNKIKIGDRITKTQVVEN